MRSPYLLAEFAQDRKVDYTYRANAPILVLACCLARKAGRRARACVDPAFKAYRTPYLTFLYYLQSTPTAPYYIVYIPAQPSPLIFIHCYFTPSGQSHQQQHNMALRTILTLLVAIQAIQVRADSSHPMHLQMVDANTAHALLSAKGLAASRDGALYNEQGFWFSHFQIGGSPDLQILIDTGSSDTILNPGVYNASSTGVDTGKTFRISYATTNPDGSGTLSVSYTTKERA